MKTKENAQEEIGEDALSSDVEEVVLDAQALDDTLAALIEDNTDEPDASTEYHEHEGGFAYMVSRKNEDGEVEYVPL